MIFVFFVSGESDNYCWTIIKSSLHADLFLIRGIFAVAAQNHVHGGGPGFIRVAATPEPPLLTMMGGAGGQCPWAECAS